MGHIRQALRPERTLSCMVEPVIFDAPGQPETCQFWVGKLPSLA